MRRIEEQLLFQYPGVLIGNQCLDFLKQDGVTEMEECMLANPVERQLNDQLLELETNGSVVVGRKPIFVASVSNFTNFLDLFRKTIRSIEVGIPVIVLARSNTSQHSYRWTKLLVDLAAKENIDAGMITFIAATLDDIVSVTSACKEKAGNLYTTCSRDLAKQIKSSYPNTIASTGGPNTLVCTTVPGNKAYDAIRTSAAIESAGQCTALRHVIVPKATPIDELTSCLDSTSQIKSPKEALEQGLFASIFPNHKGTKAPDLTNGYTKSPVVDAYYRINDGSLPATSMNEYWRKVVVDFSKIDVDKDSIVEIAHWLRTSQPISLTVNGSRKDALQYGIKLWERTALVVNTLGAIDDGATEKEKKRAKLIRMPPALSCQARPQEAEVFGEFPPRPTMAQYTKFPVIIPSSNPSYDTTYAIDYLTKTSKAGFEIFGGMKIIQNLLEEVSDEAMRGYCIVLIEYLRDVCRLNPKKGFNKDRTSLYGLQRPPLGTKSILRCNSPTTSFDSIAPIVLMFLSTTACDQFEISVDPANHALLSLLCKKHNVQKYTKSESESQFVERTEKMKDDIFQVIGPENSFKMIQTQMYPLVGQFVSLYLPMGHIKSTMANDDEFILRAELSNKWLNTLF